MKTRRIAIRPESSLEALLCLPPTIHALKKLYPDSEIGVIGEECFREGSFLIPNLDFYSSEINELAADSVFDFSNHSGESWGEESMDWKSYLQGCSSHPSCNPYHQVDLFRKAAGVDTVDANFEILAPANASQGLPSSLTGGETLRIALCTSSLDIDRLKALLDGLSSLETPISVYFLGTVSERRKSSMLSAAWTDKFPIVDLCGKQSLAETAETLRLCDITFTGPGSTAILSSGYGTFTICIDSGRNPQYYPYGHGHLVLQQTESEEFLRSLSGITGEIVRFALNGNGGNIPSLDQWQAFADENIDNYLGRIRFFATQRVETVMKDGASFTELYLRPLLFLGSDIVDVLQAFYRLLWEHSLQGRSVATFDLEILQQDALPQISTLLKPMEQLYELANFGQSYSHYIKDSLKKSDIERARHESDRLQEAEELIYSLGKSHEALGPLCAFHEKRQRLLPVSGPEDLAEQMRQQFEDMQGRVLVLLDLARTLFHTTLQKETPLDGITTEEGRTNG